MSWIGVYRSLSEKKVCDACAEHFVCCSHDKKEWACNISAESSNHDKYDFQHCDNQCHQRRW